MKLTAKPLPRARRWAPVFVTLVMTGLALTPSSCSAQGFINSSPVSGLAEFLPPPRSVRQQIREAREAIQQEQYSDAVARLGDLMRRLSKESMPEMAQDYFLNTPSRGAARAVAPGQNAEALADDEDAIGVGSANTILRQVREMLGQLPKPAMETYELRYGPLAAKILADAQPARDWSAVEQVRRQFFHTAAGYQATYLLATREWLLGNPLAVSLLLDDVVNLPRAVEQLGDEIIWMHAGACLLAGRPVPPPTQLPADFVAAEPVDPQTPPALSGEWETAVRERYSAMALTIDPLAENYPYLGGRPNRSGFSEAEMPLSNPRWMLETAGSPLQERMIEAETAQLKSSGQLPPPSWMPLRVGDQLLMRTTERLIGADYSTGKRVWQYPWFDSPEVLAVPGDDDAAELREEDDPKDILVQRVWNDVPYGQISSDGQRAYMIDSLRRIETERPNLFGMRATSAVQANKNTLVALDLATEGKLLWRLGAAETTPSSFSDAFFLGPPLPVRGQLYVMAEMAGEIVLVCLDPRDGSEVWRQVLVSVEASGITTDPVRRVAGAMPTYHEGLLICPTGAGVTIAVDLIDRTLRWANEHPRNRDFTQNAFRQPVDLPMSQLSQRWMTSVAIGCGVDIALTPAESDRMIVVDAVSGTNRFRPQPRGKSLYLAGIRNNQYLIVRADRVTAFDLKSGNEVWSTSSDLMNPGQRVSGRGAFGPSSYFLPTSRDELIEISLESGRILSRRHTSYPLGNLVAIDGEIISQATATLAVAYGEASLRPNVDRLLAADPEDYFAMIQKAELLLQDDQRDAALELLRKARELDPDSAEAVKLTIEAMLARLRSDQEVSDQDLETLRKLIDRPEQHMELLVLQIERLLKPLRSEQSGVDISQANLSAAFDLLMDLSIMTLDQPTLAGQQAAIDTDPRRQFTLDAWLTGRVAEVAAAADEPTRAELGERLLARLESRVRPNRMVVGRIVEHFAPLGRSVESFQDVLIELTDREDDTLATERIIWGTRLTTDAAAREFEQTSLLMLAEIYSRAGWAEDRRYVGQILQERIQRPDADPDEVKQVAGLLNQYPVRGEVRRDPRSWPREHVQLQWESPKLPQNPMLISDRRYARTTRLMGKQTLGWRAISEHSPLALLDQNGITHPIMVEGLTNLNSSDKEITLSGGLMIVLTPTELIAIDLFRVLAPATDPPVRWRQSLHPDGQAVAKRRSETSKFGDQINRYISNSPVANADDAQLRLGPVLGDRLFLLQGHDLICYDIVTGTQIWRTQTTLPGSGVVAGDGRVGVLCERASQVTYFDWFDGRELTTEPLGVDSMITTAGRYVLMVSKTNPEDNDAELYDPYRLEVVDGISRERVLSRIASPINLTDEARSAAYGELVDGRYMTLLDDQGHATVWDVLAGHSLADVKIPLRPRLSGLSVVHTTDRFLLMPRCELPLPPAEQGSIITIPSGMSVKDVTSVHCIEVSESITQSPEAQVTWSEVFDHSRGVTTYQPWLTPMLTLVRRQTYGGNSATRRHELDVWALDVTNGKTLSDLQGKNIGSRHVRIEAEVILIPARNEISATIQNQQLMFTFSDQPVSQPDTAPEQPTDGPLPAESP